MLGWEGLSILSISFSKQRFIHSNVRVGRVEYFFQSPLANKDSYILMLGWEGLSILSISFSKQRFGIREFVRTVVFFFPR